MQKDHSVQGPRKGGMVGPHTASPRKGVNGQGEPKKGEIKFGSKPGSTSGPRGARKGVR